MKRPCVVLMLLLGGLAVGAEPEAAYQLKNRSTFGLTEAARPPFWPIGWVKRHASVAGVVAPVVHRFALEEKNFLVTSILVGNPSLAVINGRSYMEGEFVRLPKGNAGVRVRVLRIGDGTVQLQNDDQLITVKQRRQELGLKKPDEDLLNEER